MKKFTQFAVIAGLLFIMSSGAHAWDVYVYNKTAVMGNPVVVGAPHTSKVIVPVPVLHCDSGGKVYTDEFSLGK